MYTWTYRKGVDMAEKMVRISPSAHRTLSSLSERMGLSMTVLLDKAVEQLRRQAFLDEVNAAFHRLRSDPKAWKEELEERRAWDRVTHDED